MRRKTLKRTSQGGFFSGRFEGTGLNIDETEIEMVDEKTAMAGPVHFKTGDGHISYMVVVEKESDGVWRCVYFEWWILSDKTLNEDLLTARTMREKLLSDPHRPGYHFVVPEGIAVPFDPNGAIYWKGRYHLFYIYQDKRSILRREHHWGHVGRARLNGESRLSWEHASLLGVCSGAV